MAHKSFFSYTIFIILLLATAILVKSCKPDLEQELEGNPVSPGEEETLQLVAPAGGEVLEVATSFQIKWTSNTVSKLKIEFTDDNGANWSIIAANLDNTGSYTWNPIPNKVSENCRIRVSTSDNRLWAASNVFSIIPNSQKTISLVKPNGGEVLFTGDKYWIEWVSSGVLNVKIEYSSDNGSVWNLITGSYPADSSRYNWQLPDNPSANCLIKVTDASSDTLFDISNSVFSITVPRTIKVLNPNGGETLEIGKSKTINWYSSQVASVKIEYTTDNGISWTTIVASTPSNGVYQWTPVPNTPTANGRIRISETGTGNPTDMSDSVFTIAPEQAITVTSPNGGEQWLSGSSQNITWNSAVSPDGNSIIKGRSPSVLSGKSHGGNSPNTISDVKIEYTTDGGSSWLVITESTPNNGSFVWSNIPSLNSSLCKVKVSDAVDGFPFDVSDNNFTIYNTSQQQINVTSPNGGEIWETGTSQAITWTSEDVVNVKIEYTTNNGVEWILVANNIPSNGFYQWNSVPNTVSTNCKVRISDAADGFPADLSDGVFTIAPEPGITVVSPNGGEILYAGSSHTIEWTSTNISNVKIEYTTNNGASWTVISASTPSDGFYTWTPVPSLNSTQCRIRVSDAADGLPFDVSDNNFSITNSAPQNVMVTSPNGGEVIEAGTNYDITWSSDGITNVKIEYTTNNGVSWTTLSSSTPSTGIWTWNNVPNTPSTNCRIRVSDASDGIPADISDASFSIVSGNPQSINLTSPNGGEVWVVGSNQNITWSATGISDVRVEYSTNNGANWTTVISSTPNTGSYTWVNIPNTPSATCRVRVSDAADGNPSDASDNFFSIVSQEQITVLSPNGGEVWQSGTVQSITWSTAGGLRISPLIKQNTPAVMNRGGGNNNITITEVNLEYTTNAGATWTTIANNVPNNGLYQWTVPVHNSSQCRVRVSDAVDGNPSDVSDANFTIITGDPQSITLLSPNGGETWVVGSNQDITWNATGIADVKVEFSTNNGVSWTTVISSTPNTGSYTWVNIPNTPSATCRVRVSDAADGNPSDASDNFFSIVSQEQITVLTPNGGENWMSGSVQYITWSTTSSSNRLGIVKGSEPKIMQKGSGNNNVRGISDVKIELSTNAGSSWTTIVSSVPNTGTYQWTVPSHNSSLCRIRISDASDGVPFDVSDGNFTIYNSVPQEITVTSPNGGEVWEAGTSQVITWSSTGVTNVSIEYTTNNGVNWITIVSSTASTGFYNWSQIPNTPSTNCRVRISDAADGFPSDMSNATFTIAPEPEITVVSPNGGEVWQSGSSQYIRWTSTNIANVKLEYTTNNGANWILIEASTPSDGIYTWESIPSHNSALCRVRVSDALDGLPLDISDNNFTITNQVVQAITVTSPNGGEEWEAGTAKNITWSSTGVSEVNIHYTTNNGISWISLVNNLPNAGSYQWNPIPNINSTQCRIRVSDAVDGIPSDESDATFTIRPVQSLMVLEPNGGEVYYAGDPVIIRWQSEGVENVKIEYTVNNGILPEDWFVLVESTPSNGQYQTGFSVPSNQYRIRISDAEDGSPSDQSDGTFTVEPQPSITVVSPNGGQSWLAGSTHEIRWTSVNVQNVRIEYTMNGGGSWHTIASSVPSNGIYNWSIPDTITVGSDICKVRISDAIDGNPSDVSDNFFTLHSGRFLRLTFPNGGEVLHTSFGLDTVITWNSAGIADVGLEYSVNNGLTWINITPSTPSTGAYRWTLPTTTSSQARVRVYDASDPAFRDQSNATFFLNVIPPGIRLLSPGEGSRFKAGSSQTIRWIASDDVANVNIEYSADNGKTWKLIAGNIRNNVSKVNSYKWNGIPSVSGNVIIRISETNNRYSVKSKNIRINK